MDKKQNKVPEDLGSKGMKESAQDCSFLVKQIRSDLLFIEHLALVAEPLVQVELFQGYLAEGSKMAPADLVKYVKSARAFAACIRSCPGLVDQMAVYMAAFRESGVIQDKS